MPLPPPPDETLMDVYLQCLPVHTLLASSLLQIMQFPFLRGSLILTTQLCWTSCRCWMHWGLPMMSDQFWVGTCICILCGDVLFSFSVFVFWCSSGLFVSGGLCFCIVLFYLYIPFSFMIQNTFFFSPSYIENIVLRHVCVLYVIIFRVSLNTHAGENTV